jgi:hypothetical protein
MTPTKFDRKSVEEAVAKGKTYMDSTGELYLLIKVAESYLDNSLSERPMMSSIKGLEHFTECEHKKRDEISSECIHCNFAWALERIKYLEGKQCGDIEKIILQSKLWGLIPNQEKHSKDLYDLARALSGKIPAPEKVCAECQGKGGWYEHTYFIKCEGCDGTGYMTKEVK